MRLNCDIGERGAEHPVDRDLLAVIHVANIACGGHAGDGASAAAFAAMAAATGVAVAAHLSYPDRAGFGRRRLELPAAELARSLDEQLRCLPGVRLVKLHGALYNDSAADPELAAAMADWLARRGIAAVIAPADSELAVCALRRGLDVQREAFAERRYEFAAGRLRLVPRSRPHAVIGDLQEAVEQGLSIMRRGRVALWAENGAPAGSAAIAADTLCIHSDSPIALPLAERLFPACHESAVV